jgi:Tfp pilus assembly PilM family ATPase
MYPDDMDASNLAAALRAAAEIVAPLSYEDVWTDGRILQYEKRDPVREKLLAIADELEN